MLITERSATLPSNTHCAMALVFEDSLHHAPALQFWLCPPRETNALGSDIGDSTIGQRAA